MIHALIADDEPLSRRLLHQLLARHVDVTVVAECSDGGEVIDVLERQRVDVMFLDIQMPLASGLEVAAQLPTEERPFVVFVTAFESFALPAFDVDAVDYITKPIVESRFDAALARVRARLAESPRYTVRLVERVGSREVLIPVSSVSHIEADGVYATVYWEGRKSLVRTSLDQLEHSLDPREFLRIHRSFIVRLASIDELVHEGEQGTRVRMRDGTRISVSRRRRPVVVAHLRQVTR